MNDVSQQLQAKLLDFVKQTGVNLDPVEQRQLADEYYKMVIGWIESPQQHRGAYLAKSGQEIVSRFSSGAKTYSLHLVGHFDRPSVSKEEAGKHASTFLSRFQRTLRNLMHQSPPRFRPTRDPHIPTVSLKSLEPEGRVLRIKADITVEMPRQSIKRAIARTDRRGDLKIEQLKLSLEGSLFEETAV